MSGEMLERIDALHDIRRGAAREGAFGVAIILAQVLSIVDPGWTSRPQPNGEPLPAPEWVSAIGRIEKLERELAEAKAALVAAGVTE